MADVEAVTDIDHEIEVVRRAIRRQALMVTDRGRAKELERLRLRLRTFAQNLARSAVAPVADRHNRAEAKAVIYNHLVPLLESQVVSAQEAHKTYRNIVIGLAGVSAVLLAVVGLLLSL